MFNSILKKLILIFLSICLYGHIYSQQKSGIVSGIVKEKSSGKALANVNVFISGTTLGAVTNNSGHFEIKGIPEGNYTIVASMIGYEHKIDKIEIENNKKYMVEFYLEEATYDIGTVEVSAEVPEEWKINLSTFKEYFLGTTDYSKGCLIENEYNLDFIMDETGTLNVKCPVNLVITNKALGYKIECLLLLFTFDESSSSVKYVYHTKFSEMTTNDKSEKHEWENNRKMCYAKSLKRFLKSAVNNEFYNNGYLIGQSFSPFDLKLNVRSKKKSSGKLWIKEPGPISSLEILKYDYEYDQYVLSFDNYLYVGNSITGDYSWLYLPFGQSELDRYGEPVNPVSIQAYGSFANNGTANLLPKDYEFE